MRSGEAAGLRAIYDALCSERTEYTFRDLLIAARDEGAPLTEEELDSLSGTSLPAMITPDWVVSFISLICNTRGHERILDMWAGIGTLIGPFIKRNRTASGVAICPTREEYLLAPLLNPSTRVEWRTGPPASVLTRLTPPFDAVFGWMIDSGEAEGIASLIVAGSRLLAQDGTGFFVVPGNAPGDMAVEMLASGLADAGLHLDSVLAVREFTMFLIRKIPQPSILVGVVGEDQGSRDILAKNIELRREGKAPFLGVLVERPSFHSVKEIILEQEIRRGNREAGLRPTPLAAVSREWFESEDPGWASEAEQSLFIPKSPEMPVVISAHDIISGAAEYARIVLDPGRANAHYLAGMLNTSHGRQIRELALLRTKEREEYLPALLQAEIPIPPLENQSRIVKMQSSLDLFTHRLAALGRNLWEHPLGVEKVEHELDRFSEIGGIEAWIETLPFPLASILWNYRAETNVEHRIDHLFNFFEALSEFTALVMLSALSPLCLKEHVDLLEDNPYFRDSYRYATFRAWNILGRRLSRHMRKLISSPATRDLGMRQFGNPRREFIAMMSSKRLFALLDEVADYRNVWKAHGGIAGDEEETRRLTCLESCLLRARQIIGDAFEEMLLLAPRTSEYHEGVFYYEADALVGSRTTFRKVQVETVVPMDHTRLYLLDPRQHTPLELLPLIRMMDSPCQTLQACYFYNRIEAGDIRWITYHFEGGAEVVQHDPEVIDLLTSLRLIGGSPPGRSS